MEQNKEKIRHILQYHYDKGKNASHAANKICAVYGPDTVSISTAQQWFQRFRSGVELIEDAPGSGKPVVENCDKIAESLEMTFDQNIPQTLRRHLLIKVWSLLVMQSVTVHVSEPYSRTIFTLTENTLSLVRLDIFLTDQTLFNL